MNCCFNNKGKESSKLEQLPLYYKSFQKKVDEDDTLISLYAEHLKRSCVRMGPTQTELS